MDIFKTGCFVSTPRSLDFRRGYDGHCQISKSKQHDCVDSQIRQMHDAAWPLEFSII
jgi:hypothetical protein